ncbi:MAG: hemin receptor [Gammaproteobacteria bacterium]|nr:hemin receptor [Gammaproteobacteria bacterium]
MTPEQTRLVKRSWARLQPMDDEAASLFFSRLFRDAPELRAHFEPDMRAQARCLLIALGHAIDELRSEPVAPRAGPGLVPSEHYPPVLTALLWSLEQLLGDGFDQPTRLAWSDTLAALMQSLPLTRPPPAAYPALPCAHPRLVAPTLRR